MILTIDGVFFQSIGKRVYISVVIQNIVLKSVIIRSTRNYLKTQPQMSHTLALLSQ